MPIIKVTRGIILLILALTYNVKKLSSACFIKAIVEVLIIISASAVKWMVTETRLESVN